MMTITKQKIALISAVIAILLLVICVNIPRYWANEESNIQNYSEALEEYNSGNYQHAYFEFSKVARMSNLKQAAIYRQAQCAEHLNDNQTAIKKYKELMRFYPNSPLTVRARYLKAQDFYQTKKYRRAKRDFKNIIKKYPNSDYAVASEYYLGAIETFDFQKAKSPKKKNKKFNKASHYFRDYLKEAPSGRYSLYAIKKWVGMGIPLTNEDNLLIAKAYQAIGDYKSADRYLKFTDVGASWPYFVKSALKQRDYSKVKFYTENGLKNEGLESISINEENSGMANNKEIYDAIDEYLGISKNPKAAINYLLSISQESNGYDYLLYKSCNNMPEGEGKTACYNTLYTKFPDGQFAAETLSNIFYEKIKSKQYIWAKDIGKRYLAKYSKSNSTPKVIFWMGKLSERMKNYEDSRSYYNEVVAKYPDDYYAYRAYLTLNHYSDVKINPEMLLGKEVAFPYKENLTNGLLIELADIQDYSLINELYKDDGFVQSWLAYQEGNYPLSTKLARDSMDKLDVKPDRLDLRWRLLYPVHYYNEVRSNAFPLGNNPILILSIIKEESHFNANVMSPVGAIGLMQLMPSTAAEIGRKYGVTLPNPRFLTDPAINIKIGNIYYSRLRYQSGSDVLSVLAYNSGLGSVSRWKKNLKYEDIDDFVEQIPYSETQTYLKKVYRSYWNYVRIYADN